MLEKLGMTSLTGSDMKKGIFGRNEGRKKIRSLLSSGSLVDTLVRCVSESTQRCVCMCVWWCVCKYVRETIFKHVAFCPLTDEPTPH